LNYTQLPQLVDEFGLRGFKVLCFPCNQVTNVIEWMSKFYPTTSYADFPFLSIILMFGMYILAYAQFGAQEPGTHEEIIQSVKKIDPTAPDKLTFFEKADVNGANAREVFSFLKRELPNDDGTGDIRWNFGTFKQQLAHSLLKGS
jgi:glutathione peroxidase-family protein